MTAPDTFPLTWPVGWPRTPADKVARARFNVRVTGHAYRTKGQVTNYVGRLRLMEELRRLGATDVVLSTNLPTRLDGLPYSSAKEPSDHGVAVYFRIKGEPRVLACDRWDRTADNMAALAAHVEAMRGQLRWGVGTLEQAFTGYRALPEMGARRRWWEVLGLDPAATMAEVDRKRAELLMRFHPDRGGAHDQAAEVNHAYDEARKDLAP